MKTPIIQLIPLRNAISSDHPTTLDLIVRIIPPQPEIDFKRPKLNLGLVIDRSGSMQGQKIEYARQAACYAVQQLLPSDRISVTIYDTRIDVLVPSTPIEDKNHILRQIQAITPRGSTNLHGGWLEGGTQVSRYLQPNQLNRIILLSDGLANIGQTNPDLIASDVQGLSQHGVSTTTMGIGDDYNEDLMTAMANSGDGNYYYISSPSQLPEIFNTELQGIMATVGEKVSLGIELSNGVTLVDVFNNLETTEYGRYKLPNLIIGNPIEIGIRLKVPPMMQESPLCQLRLAWNLSNEPERTSIKETLQLPIVSSAQLTDFPLNEEVTQLIALLLSARAKEEAVRHLDRRDYTAAKASLNLAHQKMESAPSSAEISQEMDDILLLSKQLDSGEHKKMRKAASYQAWGMSHSRSQSYSSRRSKLINFYLGNNSDHRGRNITDIWQWSDEQLEIVHDYIQWLFPLKEKSAFHSSAPILTDEDIITFRNSQELQTRLLTSFDLLLNFYGYQRKENCITQSPSHDVRIKQWVTPNNHNFLRITRILKSLTLLGLSNDSKQFLTILKELYSDKSDIIGTRSFNFWTKAINPLFI